MNSETTRRVRRRAWRRGGANACAALESASPPPIAGVTSASPTSDQSTTLTTGHGVHDVITGLLSRAVTGTALWPALASAQIETTARTPAPIQIPVAMASR